MTLRQLRDFVAITSCGSFRSAARRLSSSQSGLTKSIRNLESEFGVKLMSRSARGVELTYVGARFAELAQEILVAIDKADAYLRNAGSARLPVLQEADAR
jgi:DNA-binding transcriptional LysR family regulator